jgi:hypothetical protein
MTPSELRKDEPFAWTNLVEHLTSAPGQGYLALVAGLVSLGANLQKRRLGPIVVGSSKPLELLEKLAALIPRPYVNLVVYHGVLAPNAKWRREVVDFGRLQLERPSSATDPKKAGASQNRTWAELMRRGLDIDVLECSDCGGRLRFVAAILLSSAIRRILRHLGLPSDPVQLAPARAPPELDDAWAC